MKFSFTINQSNIHTIYEHLIENNDFFVPTLSVRVNINEYVQKLYNFSERFEAWDDSRSKLIGLLAIYLNNNTECCFISNISVSKEYQRKAIATKLINMAIKKAKSRHFKKIQLEVDTSNVHAIDFYKHIGFKEIETLIENLSKFEISIE